MFSGLRFLLLEFSSDFAAKRVGIIKDIIFKNKGEVEIINLNKYNNLGKLIYLKT
jgi:hypothetical protein